MISVVTLGRSASTWYCDKLAKENEYENYGEPFFRDSTAIRFRLKQHFHKRSDIVIKLIPNQWKVTSSLDEIEKLLNASEQVIFLLRKDFKAQSQSRFAGRYLKDTFGIQWHDEFTETYTVPKEYIETYWPRFIRRHTDDMKYIMDLYQSLTLDTKTIVYTEDAVADEFSKLNRPIEFEIPLNFDV